MKLPNYIVIGASKCGTKSLYYYLLDHPDIFLPRDRSEVSFFADGAAREDMITFDDYKELYSAADARKPAAILDISTPYLYDEQAPNRIRQCLGEDLKFIAFIRNPVHMVFSLWLQMVHGGYESLSFSEALVQESSRMNDEDFKKNCLGWPPNYFYYSRACYTDQLMRYIDVFGKEKLKVYIFEEFFASGLPQWPAFLSFLGVDPRYCPADLGRVFNPGGTERFTFITRGLTRKSFVKSAVARFIPESKRPYLRRLLHDFNKKPYRRTKEDEQAMNELRERFGPELRRLEKLLGRSLMSVWF